MSYDAAGNLTNDTYTGAGNRTYDAENRITSAWGGNNQAQLYGYDASGQRIKRTVDGVQSWEVYGLDGQLLAEYGAEGAAASPQKEYGYRNQELLITAAGGSSGSATQNATWTNTVGVSATGNSLTKSATGDGWNAGASSNQAIVSGDGYIEFTASELSSYRMIALSKGDASQSYEELDFAFYLGMNGYLMIYENGTNVNWPGYYATGDTLRIAVESGVVKYRKNGTVVYTSTATPSYPLRVDTSFYTAGSTANNVVISGNLGAGGSVVQWLVADQLGTPRMIIDQSGTLASVKRHDYLPFGEELYAPAGGRTTAQGYSAGDGVRQQFTAKERDNETSLDYFEARYFSSTQGRFTSPDPLLASGQTKLPQSWNRYTYGVNNPLINVDPTGLWWYTKNGGDGHPQWFDDDPGKDYTRFTQYSYYAGEKYGYIALDPYSKNYQIGFDTEEEASGYSDQLAGETLQARDPGQYVSQLDGTMEVATYISGVQGLARIGIAAGESLLVRETAQETATALTEVATQTTIHGAERGFSEADIALTKTGVQFLQRDGTAVFLKEVTPGKFNVIVEGSRGVVTALKNVSEKSVARIAANYGWFSSIAK